MRLLVKRGAGDNFAEAIFDELCCAHAPALARGRNFLYAEGFDKRWYTLSMPFRTSEVCGATVEVMDASLGEEFKGRLSGWSLRAETDERGGVTVTQTLEIERSVGADGS